MKHFFPAFILAWLLPPAAFSQSAPTGFGAALARLERARKDRPIESIHLHFDKPYYVSGDTLFFKAYVTFNEQHRPTPLSEVLHTDLIDPMGRIIQGIKLQLKQGCAYADFGLPDSLPPGRYRVRAYTRWMLNAGDCYDASFFVGGAGWTSRDLRTDTVQHSGADLQFFPEGGEMLTGIETKIAFKAVSKNGLGVKARGVVLDDAGSEITRFQTMHLGMGFFFLRPEAGRSYRATVTFADGSETTADLPKAAPQGMMLAAENDTVIHVLANQPYLQAHPNEAITLLICSNGGSSVARAVLGGGDIAFGIDKHRMHPGITRVTLFSADGQPASERLLFIKGPDSLNLAVRSDKPVYGKREKVDLSIVSAGLANFSVSVTDEDLLKTDDNEKSILSDLLLGSELKGFIEQPNYYFSHSGDAVNANLDLLLLTQGYRHFVWKQLLQDSLDHLTYKAEKYLQVQGYVRNTSGAPVKNETVTLTDSTGQGPALKATTDTAGRFAFANLLFTDTMHFILRCEKAGSRIVLSGFAMPAVDKEQAVEAPAVTDAVMSAYLKVAEEEHRIRGMAAAKVLKPVTVKARKAEAPSYTTESLAGAGNVDQVLHASDLRGGGTLVQALKDHLSGVVIERGHAMLTTDLGGGSPMMIVVDGVEEPELFAGMNALPLSTVESVEVLKSANAGIYGMNGGSGVLVITTKRGGDLEVEESPERDGLYCSFMGFYKSREFYAPRYDVRVANKNQDLRSTACWKPEVITDKDGKASFSFYNSDLPGAYRVVVEGIDADGNPGRRVIRYQVQ